MAEATQELLLRIRAETKQAERDTWAVAQALAGITAEQKATSAALSSALSAYGAASNATEEYRAEIVNEIAVLREQQTALKAQAAALQGTTGGMRNVRSASSNAQQAMFSFTNGLQDAAMAGSDIGLAVRYAGNNISQFAQQLGYVSQAAKETGTTVRQQLMGALVGSGGLIIGIQAAIAIVTILTAKFKESAREARSAADAYRDAFEASVSVDLPGASFTIRSLEDAERALAAAKALQEQTRAQEAEVRRALTDPFLRGSTNVQAYTDALAGANRQSEALAATIEGLERTAARFRVGAAVSSAVGATGLTPDAPRATGGAARAAAEQAAALDKMLRNAAAIKIETKLAAQAAREHAAALALAEREQLKFIQAVKQEKALRAEIAAMEERKQQARFAMYKQQKAAEGFSDTEIAAAQGMATAIQGVTQALGELVSLQSGLGAFFEALKRSLQQAVADFIAAAAQALILKLILGSSTGGFGFLLGGLLGVPSAGAGATLGGQAPTVNVNLGGAAYRNGGIFIPAGVVHAAVRDEDNRRSMRGRTS